MDFKVYIQKNIHRRTKAIMLDLADFSLLYLIQPKPVPDYLRFRSEYYYYLVDDLDRSRKTSSARDNAEWQVIVDELEDAYWLIWNEQRYLDLLPYIDALINDIEEGMSRSSSSITH